MDLIWKNNNTITGEHKVKEDKDGRNGLWIAPEKWKKLSKEAKSKHIEKVK